MMPINEFVDFGDAHTHVQTVHVNDKSLAWHSATKFRFNWRMKMRKLRVFDAMYAVESDRKIIDGIAYVQYRSRV